jgi:mannose-6-phosphate isomerase-like protein (cupin superfamily)
MTGESQGRRTGTGVDIGRPGWSMLASAVLTGGAFELFEELRPSTGGPPPHVHRERDEAFFVLEGRYVFVRDHEEAELVPGDFIFIPRGTRHGYRTLVAPARTLILLVPAGLEGFFREMGTHLASGATALEAMTALSDRYDSHPVD